MTDSSLWLRRAGVAVLAAAVLAGCSTSTSGRPSGPTSGDTAGTPTGTGIPPGFPTDITSLATMVNKAMVSTTSAHEVLTLDVEGLESVKLSGEGDETVDNGKSTGLQMVLTSPDLGTERLVTVDDKSYVMMPPSLRTSNKPWSLVTLQSSNTYVKFLAQSMANSPGFSGVDSARTFLAASDKLTVEGTTHLNDGTQVVHYALDVLTARLPDSFKSKQAFVAVGLKKLPTKIAIDAAGHIRQLRQQLSITYNGSTTKTDTQIEMSDYDAPVDISPPPPDQVSVRS